MIIDRIKNEIKTALDKLGYLSNAILVEKTKNSANGDFSSNICLSLAKQYHLDPMELGNQIISNIKSDVFTKIQTAKPGFINFTINPVYSNTLLKQIHKYKDRFPIFAKTKKVYNVEYVSANPTGYLHIGHARNAVFGDVISSLLEKTGNKVIREYLINDAGNQMNMLASSVLVRYKQILKDPIKLPKDAYNGKEIKLVAKDLYEKYKDKFIKTRIDDDFVIKPEKTNQLIKEFAEEWLLNQIKIDLSNIGTKFDIYFSETKIHESGLIDETIKLLGDHTYKHEGAIWLKTTEFGDDKDRVLLKSDRVPTYFLPDIAYHNIKLTREPRPTKLINVWGADHYSYITRMKIALKALGYSDDKLDVICMQMVRLIKDGEEFKMSKRTGQSLTLMDLVNAVGKDAARWFLISVSQSSHIELDVDLANQKNSKNPIYYVEYAHARANTLLNKAYFNIKNPRTANYRAEMLTHEIEKEILKELNSFENCIINAINNYEPFKLTNYLLNLAKLFHNYYSNVTIIDDTNYELTQQRLILVSATKIVIANGLRLLGIDPYINM